MNFKKLSIIVITIISIFSFNNKVDAATELNCFYEGYGNGYNTTVRQAFSYLVNQYEDGSQKYFFAMKGGDPRGNYWYYLGEKKAGEVINKKNIILSKSALNVLDLMDIEISTKKKDQKEWKSCPKYASRKAKNINDDEDISEYKYILSLHDSEYDNEDLEDEGRKYEVPNMEVDELKGSKNTASSVYMNLFGDYTNNEWLMDDVNNYDLSCLYANLNLSGTQLDNNNNVDAWIGNRVSSLLDKITLEDGIPFDQAKTIVQVDMKYSEIRVNSTLNKVREIGYDNNLLDHNVIENRIQYPESKSKTNNWTVCPKTFSIHSDEQVFGAGNIEYEWQPTSSDTSNGEMITLTLVKQNGADGIEMAENTKKINFISTNDISNCKDIITDEIADYIKLFFNIIRIGVPIIIVALTIVDLAKAIFNGEEDMKKTKDKIIKRLIIAAAFFLVPTILKVFLDIVSFIWPNIDSSLCGIFD